VKFRAWVGSSFVLTLALASTVALFYYWDQLKSQSVQMLQNRLNEIEIQRFEEDKGSQVRATARQTAARFDQLISQFRNQVEAVADSQALRRPHRKPADWALKKRAFFKLVKKNKQWAGSLLTDESGRVKVWTWKQKPPSSIASTPAFVEAAKLRITAIHMIEKPNDQLHIQFTVPCLSDQGRFLGVVQTEIPFTPADLKKITAKGGFLTIIGTSQGRRLTAGPKDNFPKNLGALLGKNLREMEAFVKTAENQYFKAKWEGTSYILVSAMTQLPKINIFTLLEISGLEQVVGPSLATESMFNDPVVLAGLAGIMFISLILMVFFSGGSTSSVKKINRQLIGMMQTGEELQFIEAPGRGEWEKLADLINQMIERLQAQSGRATISAESSVSTEAAIRDAEALSQVRSELEELHQSYDQALVQNQELNQRIEELTQQNQELSEAVENARTVRPATTETESISAPAPSAQVEELMASIKEEGTLRIEAISSISDDLKATLMVIKNYISSILSSEEGKITDAQQEFLGVVINKSARLERQINDLLEISHMESGVSQLYRSRTDLVALLQDVVLNSQPQADTKQVNIIQEMQTPLPMVMIDSDRMGQVFINLLQHAIKITPVGGEVQITATETLTDLVIKIRDSGMSLNAEQAAKVFSSFHGPNSDAGPDIAGTGLRFPIIRRIVDAHQGTVTMRGLPDRGNETVVSFPKTSDLLGTEEENSPVEMYEVKPKVGDESPSTTTVEQSESPYDLTSFMGRMDEYEAPESSTAGATEVASTGPAFPGSEEDLDKLLNDIENMEDKMD